MILLISYDLNGHERPSSYAAVKKMIEEQSVGAIRPLYSQWFVETTSNIERWHERMTAVTDRNDNWFIVEVKRPYQGWLNKSVWQWLRERL